MKYETNTLPGGDSAEKVIDSQSSFTLVYKFRLTFVCSHARIQLKEHNHVFTHAKDIAFWTGYREFIDARIIIVLLQVRFHRPQSTLALP